MKLKGLIRYFVGVMVAVVCCGSAWAQYPSHPVQILIPAGPGGSNTLVGRILAERLQAYLGQTFIIVNRGGAGGRIATNEVAKAAPDGYTLLLTFGGPIASGLALFKSVPYDVSRDFAPVALVAEVSIVMTSSPNFPAKTVKDVIAYARANPGKLTAEINSFGSMGHLLTEQFRLKNDLDINEIPYKGTGPAMTDFLADRVNIGFDTVPALAPFIKQKGVHALAIASKTRSDLLPDVPTFAELGMPGMEATVWFAVLAPAGTPKAVIDRLSQALGKAVQSSKVKDSMAKLGIVPHFAPPEETAKFIQQETERWTKVIKASGMEKVQ